MQNLCSCGRYALLLLLWSFLSLTSAREWVGASLKHDYSKYLIQEEGTILATDPKVFVPDPKLTGVQARHQYSLQTLKRFSPLHHSGR